MSDFNSLDLDSLDALLDAAEIEAVSHDESAPTDPPTEAVAADDWSAALAEQAAAPEEEDPWASALAEQAGAASEPEPEEDPWASALAEQAAAPEATVAPTPVPTAAPTLPPTPEPTLAATPAPTFTPEVVPPVAPVAHAVAEHDDREAPAVYSKNKQPNNTETWTDAEMDSIKKLIIIFSSVIIVLVLAAIGISLGGLLSSPSADPKLVETVDSIKNDVGQAYLITEDSGKQLKTMGTQLSDVATQLAEIAEAIETLKKAPVIAHVAPAVPASSKALSASERKAAMREEIQANAAADGEQASDSEAPVVEKVEKTANSAQVKALAVDILDVKKRLVATQKLLEQISKQSEALQLQSLTLTEAVKAVEVEVKSHKPPPKVVSVAPKAAVDKKAEEKPVAPPVQVKPADDPQFRARWSREMGKSDGFP